MAQGLSSLRANGSARSRRPMTGSAKQSRRIAMNKELDCFVAGAPRNDETAVKTGFITP
jgi:hypothetical protein